MYHIECIERVCDRVHLEVLVGFLESRSTQRFQLNVHSHIHTRAQHLETTKEFEKRGVRRVGNMTKVV